MIAWRLFRGEQTIRSYDLGWRPAKSRGALWVKEESISTVGG